MQRHAVEIGGSCHTNAPDAFGVLLGSDDNERLAVDQTAGCILQNDLSGVSQAHKFRGVCPRAIYFGQQ